MAIHHIVFENQSGGLTDRPTLPSKLIRYKWDTVYLMKGLVTARTVLMNHDGWRIMKDFRFFLSLKTTQHVTILGVLMSVLELILTVTLQSDKCWQSCTMLLMSHEILSWSPSINHLIAFLQPTKTRHSSVGCGTIQVHNHVVLRHHQLQCADHVAEDTHTHTIKE